ncbi:MAG: sigma-70 family RNA polymerase sigma factor [bacterium]|jgi:RNA polymerase sigma-70 factor (ECF subfamily)
MQMTEAKAAVGLRQRDPAALEYVFREYGAAVWRLAGRIIGNLGSQEDREECVSDVFVRVWEDIAKYDPARGSLRAWVLQLGKYQALDVRRCLAKRKELPADLEFKAAEASVEEEVLSAEQRRELLTAIGSLGATDRAIFLRRYYAMESIESIARDLGLTRQAVDNRLWRGRQRIKLTLETAGRGIL